MSDLDQATNRLRWLVSSGGIGAYDADTLIADIALLLSAPTPECATAAAQVEIKRIFAVAEQDALQSVQALLNRYRHDEDWRQVAIKQRADNAALAIALSNSVQLVKRLRHELGDSILDPDGVQAVLNALDAHLAAEHPGKQLLATLEQLQREADAARRLPDLVELRAAGWLWEVGCCEHRGSKFYARVWLPNFDPLHEDSPAAEHGETPEEATEQAWEERKRQHVS